MRFNCASARIFFGKSIIRLQRKKYQAFLCMVKAIAKNKRQKKRNTKKRRHRHEPFN